MESSIKLFSPCKIGKLDLKNHIVMAPMTRCRAIDNLPNDLMATYYSQRVQAGLIITEATAPSPNGLGAARIPGIFTPGQIEGWKKTTEAVHRGGSKIFLQIMHTGRISHKLNMPVGARILAPSAVAFEGTIWTDSAKMQTLPVPEEMSYEDISSTIEEFALAARNAMSAGFDGVELHSANGYLLHEFLNPASNLRNDEYGLGSQDRFRFLLETIRAVSGEIGKDKTGVHLSPFSNSNGMTLFEGFEVFYLDLIHAIDNSGVAYIHLVMPETDYSHDFEDSFAFKARKAAQGMLIFNNGFNREKAERVLALGYADLVSFARGFLANPDLVTRFQKNQPLNKPDRLTFYSAGEKGYTDYPFSDNV